jgi:hypothetical protein
MSQDNDRHLVRQVIQRLTRDKRGFGERSWSFYSPQEADTFISHVLGLEPMRNLLPYGRTGNLGQDLSKREQQLLKDLVDRVDRYGDLVTGWRRGRPVSPSCLEDLEGRLEFWAFRNMPQHCWGRVHLRQVVAGLMNALQANITSYSYTEDLLVWAIPFLIQTLWAQAEEVSLQVREGVDVPRLRGQLEPEAQRILRHLREVYGIHGLEASEVTERALRLLMCADDAEYAAHQDQIREWAMDKLRSQIKLQLQSYVEPDMGPDWHRDPGQEAWELRKRQRLLQVLYEEVRRTPQGVD